MNQKIKERLKELCAYMEEITKDTTVPRNVKKAILDAKAKIENDKDDLIVRLSSANFMLDEISNDINILLKNLVEYEN